MASVYHKSENTPKPEMEALPTIRAPVNRRLGVFIISVHQYITYTVPQPPTVVKASNVIQKALKLK